MKTFTRIGAIGLLCIVSAAAAQDVGVQHPQGTYIQAPTGMTYPEAVGPFHRVNVIRYQPDGSDESAGYNVNTPMQEINMTVYVFPAPPLHSFGSPQDVIDSAKAQLCTNQFHAVENEVTSAHPDAQLAQDGPFTLKQGANEYAGFKASYVLNNPHFFGRTNVVSNSELYLFCFQGGKWTVEYRIDYPKDYDASSVIADFMRDLTWTIKPEE